MYTLIPLLFMFYYFWAIYYNIKQSLNNSNHLILFIASIMLFLQIWILIEGLIVLFNTKKKEKIDLTEY